MTEKEWLACEDWTAMVDYLVRGKGVLGKAGSLFRVVLQGRWCPRKWTRKLDLFVSACCRRTWASLPDPSRAALDLADAFADRDVPQQQRDAAAEPAWALCGENADGLENGALWAAAALLSRFGDPVNNVYRALLPSAQAKGVRVAIDPAVRALLLDVIGVTPFRRVRIDPTWRGWNGGAVVQLARAAYDERALPPGTLDPTRLAVLADALEEAGCAAGDVLGHLRGPGPHVRGCHVVDALLGRE